MIQSADPHIEISGGSAKPYFVSNTPLSGAVRYNGQMQRIEVYDGNSWFPFSEQDGSLRLSKDTHDLIEWARKKRAEEELARSDPRTRDLYEKLEIMTTLIAQEKNPA